jgi:hypothetical protein
MLKEEDAYLRNTKMQELSSCGDVVMGTYGKQLQIALKTIKAGVQFVERKNVVAEGKLSCYNKISN